MASSAITPHNSPVIYACYQNIREVHTWLLLEVLRRSTLTPAGHNRHGPLGSPPAMRTPSHFSTSRLNRIMEVKIREMRHPRRHFSCEVLTVKDAGVGNTRWSSDMCKHVNECSYSCQMVIVGGLQLGLTAEVSDTTWAITRWTWTSFDPQQLHLATCPHGLRRIASFRS